MKECFIRYLSQLLTDLFFTEGKQNGSTGFEKWGAERSRLIDVIKESSKTASVKLADSISFSYTPIHSTDTRYLKCLCAVALHYMSGHFYETIAEVKGEKVIIKFSLIPKIIVQ